tara:strand:- start:610 stop:990 length:381 start_codon:yes stop_codon:yes gene_type:complete
MGNLMSNNKDNSHNENQVLREENLKLNERLVFLEEEIKKLQVKTSISQESIEDIEKRLQESVSKMVDTMLENDNINSSLIPDYIEKKIYTNVFKLLIGLLKETLESTSINLLNQSITLKMLPKLDN